MEHEQMNEVVEVNEVNETKKTCCDFDSYEGRLYIQQKIAELPPAEKLREFSEFYSSLPKQGTKAWENSRFIGASQIASILGQNPYRSCREETESILRLKTYDRNLFTTWGNIFEPVAKLALERHIVIHEFSSLPGFGRPTVTSCSPDGVFLYNDSLDEETYGTLPEAGTACMLEIKCPFRREIKEIPTYYYPQMYMGMSTISFVSHTLFCEFAIRLCSAWDFNFTSTQKTIQPQKTIRKTPYAIGFVAVYGVADIKAPIEVNVDVAVTNGELLEQMGKMYRALDKCIEVEKIAVFLRHFPAPFVSEFFHKKIVIPPVADLGATNNFLTPFVENYDFLLESKFWYSPLLTADHPAAGSDWAAKEWLQAQLHEVPLTWESANLCGIMPYKILDKKYESVPKIDYREQIHQVLTYAKKIMNVKSQPRETWPQILETLDL